jgi:hypothetical protein
MGADGEGFGYGGVSWVHDEQGGDVSSWQVAADVNREPFGHFSAFWRNPSPVLNAAESPNGCRWRRFWARLLPTRFGLTGVRAGGALGRC